MTDIILLGQNISEQALSIRERFDSKIYKTCECWVWTAAKDPKGYGRFGIGPAKANKTHFAHRIALALSEVFFTDDDYVLHKCDNPPCVRPDHLFVGDHIGNMEDWRIKGYRQRKDACIHGHEWTQENTHTYKWKGYILRRCRECERLRSVRRKSGPH